MSEDVATLLAQKKAKLLARLQSTEKSVETSQIPHQSPSPQPPSDSQKTQPDEHSIQSNATDIDPQQPSQNEKRRKKRKARREKERDEEEQLKEMETRRQRLSHHRKLEYLNIIHEGEQKQKQELLLESTIAQNKIAQTIVQHTKEVDAKSTKNAKVTRRERKDKERISLAELKILAKNPELIEPYDNTAPDPFFLVYIKCYPSTVPVSMHWSQKRRLLANKHGSEKSTFVIPNYIEQLNARILVEKDDKTLRQELRDRARAHMHRHNIDYQEWENAFYIHMPRVKFEKLENSYYELKELDDQFKHYSPLNPLSTELMRALGMTSSREHGTPVTVPPPWIENMAIHGPPPSYPNIYIPGVNAPLPYGATWGVTSSSSATTHGGPSSSMSGWGKPPTRTITITDPVSGTPYAVDQPIWKGDLYGQSAYFQQIQLQQRDMESRFQQQQQQQQQQQTSSTTTPQPSTQQEQIQSIAGSWIGAQGIPFHSSPIAIPFFQAQQEMGLDSALARQHQSFIRRPQSLSLFGAIDHSEMDRKIEEKYLKDAQEEERLAQEKQQEGESSQKQAATPQEIIAQRHSVQAINEARIKALPAEYRDSLMNPYNPKASSNDINQSEPEKQLYTILKQPETD